MSKRATEIREDSNAFKGVIFLTLTVIKNSKQIWCHEQPLFLEQSQLSLIHNAENVQYHVTYFPISAKHDSKNWTNRHIFEGC